jgi:CDP-glucose 4,6-dehydratase
MSGKKLVMFANTYAGRRVLITGHSGFKGGWLSVWLSRLGAEVIGFSVDVPTQPAIFDELKLAGRFRSVWGDVRDLELMRGVVRDVRPDFVFHLAAQPIVSRSYSDPVETMTTNVMGTMNILESMRSMKHPCIAVLITSDKCYDNVEWAWGYRETDALGGKDVYSGSKGAAELVIKSYLHSFFRGDHPVRFAIGRAGNVIGGGDWARDRIVADCVRAWSEKRAVEIRSPQSTRPWQHVLEPLSGYLRLGQALEQNAALHGEAFNFGPRAQQNRTVVELLSDLGKHWDFTDAQSAYRITGDIPFEEAVLLKLNCDKALLHLKWEPNLDYAETVRLVGEWYSAFYRGDSDMYDLTLAQLADYERLAAQRQLSWARSE